MHRDKIFDSLKFMLVCIVVYAHSTTYLYTNKPTMVLLSFLGSFTIPLFIFISGYFSKNITWGKYKKSFIALSCTYIAVQFVYSIPDFFAGSTTLIQFLTVPFGGLWYVLGLLLWRFIILAIAKIKPRFIVVLLIAITIPLLFGFLKVKITSFRIVTYFPYFILGYYCPENILNKIKTMNPVYSVIGLSIIFISLALYKDLYYYVMANFGEGSYSIFPTVLQGFLYRLLLYPFSAISCLFIINLATDRFYKLGKYSLGVFLLHPCLIFCIRYFLPSMNLKFPILFEIPFAMVIILLCLLLLQLKPIQYWVSPILLFSKKNK